MAIRIKYRGWFISALHYNQDGMIRYQKKNIQKDINGGRRSQSSEYDNETR